MARQIHHIVVCYDIHDQKRLQRVGKAMKDFGERVQKSVFECNLTDREFLRMKQVAEMLIDPIEDSVRYYFLCDRCLDGVEVEGWGMPFREEEEFTIIHEKRKSRIRRTKR